MADFGRWSEPGLPHAGWQYVDIFSLEADQRQTCGMCQRTEIRHVHVMEHPDVPELIEAGAVCAAKMAEEHVDAAKAREQRLKSGLSKRWRIARNGSPYLRIRGGSGAVAFVNQSGPRWSVTINRSDRTTVFKTASRFRSKLAAKLAAETEGARLVAEGRLNQVVG